MVCECEDKTTRSYSKYYDTPDGVCVSTKMKVAARYGIITGLIFGTYDVMMYSHAVGLGNVLKRYFIHVAPLGAMGATFAVVSNYLVQYREKEDGLNYFLGGFACAPLIGWYLGSRHAYLLGGLALGMAGLVKYTALEYNHEFFPSLPYMASVNSHKHDWSLLPDPRDVNISTCGERFPVKKKE